MSNSQYTSERELGSIGSSIKHMETRMDVSDRSQKRLEDKLEEHSKDTSKRFEEMHEKLQEIKDLMNEIKGGWKATTIIVGFASTLGAAIVFILRHLFGIQ